MKRLVASIIAFVLAVGLLPAFAGAEEGSSNAGDDFAALLQDGEPQAGEIAPSTQTAQSGFAADAAAQKQLAPQADGTANYSFDSTGLQTGLEGVQASAKSLGIGGGGALFAPAISPHDPKTFITGCDMGGVYVTHDAGGSWERHELAGQTMYAVTFDPTRKGYVYAASSGLARSRDNGDTWELLWPKPASILADPNKYEDLRHHYYNTGNWKATASVKAIAVDPSDPKHLYILANCYLQAYDWNLGWELFESTDDGATFSSMGIAPYDNRGIESGFDDPRLLVLGGKPYAFVQTGIFRPGEGKELECVHNPDGTADTSGVVPYSVVSADLMPDGRVAVAEALDAVPASDTYRPRTSLRIFKLQQDGTLAVDEDLTSELGVSTSDFPLICDRHGGSDFSVSITHVRASGKRLYFVNVSQQAGHSGTIYLLGLCDLEKAAGSHMRWVFGFPLWDNFWKNDRRPFDEFDVVDRGHSDTFYQQYGVATDPSNPKAFLLDTAGGCFYSDDCDFRRDSGGNWPSNRSNIRQLYTKSPAKDEYVTTGIDEQTTYGLRQDPFDANHLAMLYTDVGLYMSKNGGASWYKCDSANTISGNVYDFAFDRHVQGIAYSAWSAQHDAPYNKDFATTGARGGVASSTDGGVTWTKIGTGLPEALVPTRLAVVYPASEEQRQAGTNRTIWLATFGRGFWRSDDSGQNFVEVNGGVSKTSDGLILGADIVASDDGSHVFALTTRGSSSQGKTQGGSHGRVYEWDATAGAWRQLAWPEGANVECPKTLCWDEERSTLYVSCIAAFDRVMNSNVDYVNFGGGLFSYRPGTDSVLSAVNAASAVVGSTSNIEGCATDSAGNLFVSNMRGSVFLRRAGESEFVKLYDGFHFASKDVQLVSEATDADGANDDVLALPTFGGGLLKLDVHVMTACQLHGHEWGQATYEWSDDLATCTARRVCGRDEGHVEAEKVQAAAEVRREPTCTQRGQTIYTASFASDNFEAQTRTADDIAVNPDAHDWGEWAVTVAPTKDAEGVMERTCARDASHVERQAIPKEQPTGVEYFEFEGDGATRELGSGGTLAFTFKRATGDDEAFQHFKGIQVDGADVDASSYDAAPGSVVVTLHADYLDALPPGEHVLRALFDDGNDPTAAFTVQARQGGPGDAPAGSTSTSEDPGGSPGGVESAPSSSSSTPAGADDASGGSKSTSTDSESASAGSSGSASEGADDASGGGSEASGGRDGAKRGGSKAGSPDRKAPSAADRGGASTVPGTGDPALPLMLAALALACAAALALLVAARES